VEINNCCETNRESKGWWRDHWISILALIISALSALFAYSQYSITKSLSHMHIEPTLKIMFDIPKTGNPIFAIANIGDIKVISVSGKYNEYFFDKKINKIKFTAKTGNIFDERWMYIKELNPNEHKKFEVTSLKLTSNNPIIVHVHHFELKYFRESDMKEYLRQDFYFLDSGRLYNHKEYTDNISYKKIMFEIENLKVQIPRIQTKPGQIKESLDLLDRKEIIPPSEQWGNKR